MDDQSAELIGARAMLQAGLEAVDRLLHHGPRFTDDERILIGAAIKTAREMPAKSRRDALRWAESYRAGDEAFIVLHCTRKGTVEATYHPVLNREQRAAIGRN